MKPLCMYITSAPDYEGDVQLKLEFDDRQHWCYAGVLMRSPKDWACGLHIPKLCLSYPLEFDEFMYLLSRIRESPWGPLAAQHRTSCYPVWATTDGVTIGGTQYVKEDFWTTEGRERIRAIYEDFWDERLTSHN